MQPKALICDATQSFSLDAVVLPEMSADRIRIRTAYTGISTGTEFALIRNKISWGPYPLCTGYMGTGVVEEVGANIAGNFCVGDRVFFRANGSMRLAASDQAVSVVSGTHCTHVVLDSNSLGGLDKLPDGAPLDLSSMFVVPAVGLAGVNMANPKMGEHVVVYGAGLIGLGVIVACAARGCVVTAVDVNPAVLEIAAKLGADFAIDSGKQNVADHVKKLSPAGAHVVFECTGSPKCIDPAIALCKRGGSFIWQGNYGAAPISMHFLPAHERLLTMYFPCDDGGPPCRRAVIKNMARGWLPWQHVVTHRINWRQAPAMFADMNRGAVSPVGVLIDWTGE